MVQAGGGSSERVCENEVQIMCLSDIEIKAAPETDPLLIPAVLVLALILGFQAPGCDTPNQAFQSAYFPMDADSVTVLKNCTGVTLLLKVSGAAVHGSRVFSRVEQRYRWGDGMEAVEIREYRVSDSGSVLRRYVGPDSVWASRVRAYEGVSIPRDGISMWYDLHAKPGQTWFAFSNSEIPFVNSPMGSVSVNMYRITLESTSDTLTVEGTIVVDCMRFRIENLNSSGGPYRDWLAKGYGLIRRKWDYTPDSCAYAFSERYLDISVRE